MKKVCVLFGFILLMANMAGYVCAEDYDCYQNYRLIRNEKYKDGEYTQSPTVKDFDNPIKLKEGNQICGVGLEYLTAYPYYKVYDTVLTCSKEDDGTFKLTTEECPHSFAGEEMPCVYDDTSKTAKCTSEVKTCSIVYNGNVVGLSSGGGTACIPNTNNYGTCDNSGDFTVVGSCGDSKTYYCTTTLNGNGFSVNYGKYGYKCNKFDCSIEDSGNTFTAKNTEYECITVNGSWYQAQCNNGDFDKGEGCGSNRCVENEENVLTCVSDNDAQCSKVNGNTVKDSDYKSEGGKVCYSNSIYVCSKLKAPSFTLEKDCSTFSDESGNAKKCGVVKGVIGCYSNKEIKESGEDQSFITIEISTDAGFMCTLSTGETGVSTAFGCIPITASGLANKLLPILFGIAGGISFLRMIFGFIMMATSSGDEKKFIEAKSVVSSAIIGLLVSIFAIFLFRLIFVNILQIPGLS